MAIKGALARPRPQDSWRPLPARTIWRRVLNMPPSALLRVLHGASYPMQHRLGKNAILPSLPNCSPRTARNLAGRPWPATAAAWPTWCFTDYHLFL